ncbi:hypothetical protein CONLIGDRAFT_242577 [Coniochaeta ligniaria NRRL 30616]|uniref:Dol-P-Glc:Glc(2)Man(9)GlcNAc(2)-PP-Dol alpha-1,2-glucosyltransferase n=1 Tax=Coniochaeta ligniaria NRRL 30616 TaxID=1408157 RepID=A0A1J7IWG8_9PEZI|nr:hypothetical protein CONLIGDRAFT_242577 [Coniochaeta ligniaria NRRL 30616]
MFKLPIDSPVPETLILVLLQAWRFLSGRYGWGFYLLAWLLGSPWLNSVTESASEPYLDEVFHIPQAQAYCEGKFGVWDDKITTPPGLYLLAALYHKIFRGSVCSVYSLRRMNLLGVVLIHLVASSCRRYIEVRGGRESSPSSPTSSYAYHTAVNVALFPVLFFFSALFYTDVYSALFVLLAYQNHLSRLSNGKGVLSDMWTVCLGVSTLLMRQTNVFWVVVYMGGLEAVHVIRTLNPPATEKPGLTTLWSVTKFYARRYSLGDIHDPPLSVSSPDDWLFCVLSIAIAAICNPLKVLKQIWPYVSVVTIFTGFVAWNGGVVLGDKSNHVATIHLAQMLYLWPLFAFFSAPLIIPSAISSLIKLYKTLLGLMSGPRSAPSPNNAREPIAPSPTVSLQIVDFLISNAFYPCFLLGAAVFSVGIVKYNTIIHPFTLADNRHYMFYVFRYTILRSQLARFSLVGAYMVSAHLIWSRLAGCPPTSDAQHIQYINRPFDSNTLVKQLNAKAPGRNRPQAPVEKPSAPPPNDKKPITKLEDTTSLSAASPATSTALLWLATTTLSLISAPLVEPRYFTLPWIFWRLLVPAWTTPPNPPERLRALPGLDRLNALGRRVDLTVALETAWFVAVNLATFWVFLSRPYQWRDVEGRVLDEGRWQRFMW